MVGSAVETMVWSSAARNIPSISAPKTGIRVRLSSVAPGVSGVMGGDLA